MEHFDFEIPWEVEVIFYTVIIILYYNILSFNYFLIILLRRFIKIIVEKKTTVEEKNIFTIAIPYFISAIVLYFVNMLLFIFPLQGTKFIDFISSNPFFIEPILFYLISFITYTIGLTCLSLTRYYYSVDWIKTGNLSCKRNKTNFFIWASLYLILISASFVFYMLWYVLLVLSILVTYAILKWRNINKSTILPRSEKV